MVEGTTVEEVKLAVRLLVGDRVAWTPFQERTFSVDDLGTIEAHPPSPTGLRVKWDKYDGGRLRQFDNIATYQGKLESTHGYVARRRE